MPSIYTSVKEYKGWDGVHKFGYHGDMATTDIPAIVWDGQALADNNPFPTTAVPTSITSSSTEDAEGGNGVSVVEVQGVDANLQFIKEDVTLEGQGVVILTKSYFRVFRMKCKNVGSNGVNVGNISVKHATTTIAMITAGRGQTLMATYTVPLNYGRVELLSWHVALARANNVTAELSLFVRNSAAQSWRTIDTISLSRSGTNAFSFEYHNPQALTPGCDIKWVVNELSASSSGITATFDLVQRPNTQILE